MPVTYPFDTTGKASSNLIKNELHPVTEANYKNYYYIIPNLSPFYAEGLIVKLQTSGGPVNLVEGIDYYLSLPFIGGTRSIGKPLYGSIVFNLTTYQGIVEIDYQTLGGEWIADKNYVLTFMAEKVYNPRTTFWDTVTNIQNTFPPINHPLDYDDISGQGDIVNAIHELSTAIIGRPNSAADILIIKDQILQILNTLDLQQTEINNQNDKIDRIPEIIANSIPTATSSDIAQLRMVPKYVTLDQVIKLINMTSPSFN